MFILGGKEYIFSTLGEDHGVRIYSLKIDIAYAINCFLSFRNYTSLVIESSKRSTKLKIIIRRNVACFMFLSIIKRFNSPLA